MSYAFFFYSWKSRIDGSCCCVENPSDISSLKTVIPISFFFFLQDTSCDGCESILTKAALILLSFSTMFEYTLLPILMPPWRRAFTVIWLHRLRVFFSLSVFWYRSQMRRGWRRSSYLRKNVTILRYPGEYKAESLGKLLTSHGHPPPIFLRRNLAIGKYVSTIQTINRKSHKSVKYRYLHHE